MIVDGGIVQMSVSVGGQTSSDAVGLGQRDVVALEMLLQAGQLPERLRTPVHHAPVRPVTYKRWYDTIQQRRNRVTGSAILAGPGRVGLSRV